MAWGSDPQALQRHAAAEGEGRLAILSVVVLGAAAVLLAVGTQLSQVRGLHGTERIAMPATATSGTAPRPRPPAP